MSPAAAPWTLSMGDRSSENAKLLLMKQLKDLSRSPVEGFSAGLKDDSNAFVWEVMLMGPPDTL